MFRASRLAHSNDNRLTTGAGWTFTYDLEGNMTKKVAARGLTWTLRSAQSINARGTPHHGRRHACDLCRLQVRCLGQPRRDLDRRRWRRGRDDEIRRGRLERRQMRRLRPGELRYLRGDEVDELLGRNVVAGANQGIY